MLGDYSHFLGELRSCERIDLSLNYAIYDRKTNDFFYDPFEIAFAERNNVVLVRSLASELSDLEDYQLRPAYSYFFPKNDLCFRRMIYLPLKDLVARYAFVSAVADVVDEFMSPFSFANRRAAGRNRERMLLAPFATSGWANFCSWQHQQVGRKKVLLKTDISAYYDSISHRYLIDALCRITGMKKETKLLDWFSRLLRPNVISYSSDPMQSTSNEELHQGLCIGNSVDGYLANIFLHEADDLMERYCSSHEVTYGRYNDDIRLFANTKAEAMNALRVLQEFLLSRGLNLNSSKTKFAETRDKILELISQPLEYCNEDELSALDAQAMEMVIDKPLGADDECSFSGTMSSTSDAKKFCKYLHRRVSLEDRQPSHIRDLVRIFFEYPANTKYACWLIVESVAHKRVSKQVKHFAARMILRLLRDQTVSTYAKYRILHHLSKPRDQNQKFFDRLDERTKRAILAIVDKIIFEHSFDLKIACLFLKFSNGSTHAELHKFLISTGEPRLSLPLNNVLTSLKTL